MIVYFVVTQLPLLHPFFPFASLLFTEVIHALAHSSTILFNLTSVIPQPFSSLTMYRISTSTFLFTQLPLPSILVLLAHFLTIYIRHPRFGPLLNLLFP